MPTSLELYAENENEIESKACVFETEYNIRNQKMLRIHFYGNEKINCPGFKKISVKDMMENRQKVFIVLNDSTLKEFELRIFDWTTVRSLINVQSVINVKGDKFSKKNKLTGRKSSLISVQGDFFQNDSETHLTLEISTILFLTLVH